MFTVLSSWQKSLREFILFIWRMQTSARRLPTLRPGQPTWAASPPVGCYMAYIHHRHLLLLSPKADAHSTIPRRVEGWVNLGTQHATLHHRTTLPMGVRRFVHGSNLAGSQTSHLRYASPRLTDQFNAELVAVVLSYLQRRQARHVVAVHKVRTTS